RFVAFVVKCGDTVLPEVVVARRLTVFLEDDIDRLFPRDRWVRAVAHPTRLPVTAAPRAERDGTCCDPADAGVLVAVGPEGGWVEPDELEYLQSFGFQ
ncbi:unnamed protein product, partial [Hapterophycus canaliculatus]